MDDNDRIDVIVSNARASVRRLTNNITERLRVIESDVGVIRASVARPQARGIQSGDGRPELKLIAGGRK